MNIIEARKAAIMQQISSGFIEPVSENDIYLHKGVQLPTNTTTHRQMVMQRVNESFGVQPAQQTNEPLEKGEGSRGGKIIGHTKSGKPVYQKLDKTHTKSFTTEDHRDAANKHLEMYDKHGSIPVSGKNQDYDDTKRSDALESYDYHNKKASKRESKK